MKKAIKAVPIAEWRQGVVLGANDTITATVEERGEITGYWSYTAVKPSRAICRVDVYEDEGQC